MLVNLKCILDEAYKNYYAVGSFNGYNFETFKGIVEAGAETKTPVILAFGAKYLPNMSVETAAAMAKSLSEEVSIPVCLHLDHCKDQGVVYRALKAGFGSVMYDGSALPFEENLQNTLDVCRVAHACGASVEAELGSLAAGERSHEGSAGIHGPGGGETVCGWHGSGRAGGVRGNRTWAVQGKAQHPDRHSKRHQ